MGNPLLEDVKGVRRIFLHPHLWLTSISDDEDIFRTPERRADGDVLCR